MDTDGYNRIQVDTDGYKLTQVDTGGGRDRGCGQTGRILIPGLGVKMCRKPNLNISHR